MKATALILSFFALTFSIVTLHKVSDLQPRKQEAKKMETTSTIHFQRLVIEVKHMTGDYETIVHIVPHVMRVNPTLRGDCLYIDTAYPIRCGVKNFRIVDIAYRSAPL